MLWKIFCDKFLRKNEGALGMLFFFNLRRAIASLSPQGSM